MSTASPLRETEWRRRSYGSGLRGDGAHPTGGEVRSIAAAMGRPGIEGELDGAMLYLASDASSFVTGHVLQVSGGWTAT